jgi:hypothetical protein
VKDSEFNWSTPLALIASFKHIVVRPSSKNAHRVIVQHHTDSQQMSGHVTVANYAGVRKTAAFLSAEATPIMPGNLLAVLKHHQCYLLPRRTSARVGHGNLPARGYAAAFPHTGDIVRLNRRSFAGLNRGLRPRSLLSASKDEPE